MFAAGRQRWEEQNPQKRREIWRRQAMKRSLQRRAYAIPAAGPAVNLMAVVRSLVPYGVIGRDDIVGDILLALLEGKTTVEQLRRDGVRAYITGFRRTAYEARGYAISLDTPLGDGTPLIERLASNDEAK